MQWFSVSNYQKEKHPCKKAFLRCKVLGLKLLKRERFDNSSHFKCLFTDVSQMTFIWHVTINVKVPDFKVMRYLLYIHTSEIPELMLQYQL
jgi:hypothetical protein